MPVTEEEREDIMTPLNRTRREFLRQCAAVSASATIFRGDGWAATPAAPGFRTRGVVLVPEDLTLADWPERAHRARLSTIALHPFPGTVIKWIRAEAGQRFLEQCRTLGLEVEYELHAMRELLPRSRFAQTPDLFRMDANGQRTADANCCPSNDRTLEAIAQAAVEIAQTLRPTTGRYFYWGDDGRPWCQCPKCRTLSESDQALLVENATCEAVRRQNPQAQVAHLAYHNTLQPPKQIKPAAGVFLEYAPIQRRYDIPYEQQQNPTDRDSLSALDANLKVFPRETAQVLEYWLDVSRFSKWKRPSVKLPWRKDVFLADLDAYHRRGIRHVTTFAVFVDADYQKRYSDLTFIDDYGAGLAQSRP
jgi:hypothetical protein